MNYYEILNVNRNATQKEIKDSYRILAKKYHPDRYRGDKTFAERKMQEINSAYDVLSDEELKKEYDLSLSPNYYNEYNPKDYTNYNSSYDDSKSSYSSSATSGDKYDQYQKVYNDYLNKKSGNYQSNNSNYRRATENYSDYYKASAYKTGYSTSYYTKKEENFIQKKLFSLSKLQLSLCIIIIYLFIIISSIFDLTTLSNHKEKANNLVVTETRNSIVNTQKPNYAYKDFYVINGEEVSLEELRVIYLENFTHRFSSFSKFIDFVEQIED